MPNVQARGAIYAIGTPGRSWQLTGRGMLPAAREGAVHVAKAMAGTAGDATRDPDLGARAPRGSPVPPEAKPPLGMSKGAA